MKKISILSLVFTLLISTFAIANDVNILNARHGNAFCKFKNNKFQFIKIQNPSILSIKKNGNNDKLNLKFRFSQKILIINHETGSRKIEWSKIAIDANEARAAKTLICPTRRRKIGIKIAPAK